MWSCQHQQKHHRHARACKGCQRQCQRKGCRYPCLQRQNRAESGRGGDADQPGLGQWVAQKPLKGGPRQSKADAHHHRQKRARQADFLHHQRDRLAAIAEKRREAFTHAEPRRADQKRDRKKPRHQKRKKREQSAHQLPSNSSRKATSRDRAETTAGVPQIQSELLEVTAAGRACKAGWVMISSEREAAG